MKIKAVKKIIKREEKKNERMLSQEKRYLAPNGIGIDVRINFRKRRITIIDKNRNENKFVFAKREIEYMNG
jgi:hypothetical protein